MVFTGQHGCSCSQERLDSIMCCSRRSLTMISGCWSSFLCRSPYCRTSSFASSWTPTRSRVDARCIARCVSSLSLYVVPFTYDFVDAFCESRRPHSIGTRSRAVLSPSRTSRAPIPSPARASHSPPTRTAKSKYTAFLRTIDGTLICESYLLNH